MNDTVRRVRVAAATGTRRSVVCRGPSDDRPSARLAVLGVARIGHCGEEVGVADNESISDRQMKRVAPMFANDL